MVLQILRALFVLLMAAVGYYFVDSPGRPFGDYTWLAMSVSLTVGVLLVCVDILSPRKKLLIFSGTALGILVGLFFAWVLSFVVQLLVDQYLPRLDTAARNYQTLKQHRDAIIQFLDLLVGVACCYLAISFIMQTKDDFRFVIPYVEFKRETRGPRPLLVDTSVIIDGRILDIAQTGILESRLVIPRFVLQELQTLADQPDKLKRTRGRRGLDVLNKLQEIKKVEVIISDYGLQEDSETRGVDHKLLVLAKELNGRILTNDVNLSKVAQVQSVDVININDLATSLRPVVLPGERMHVRLMKAGEDPSQGVGYLDDGTMVVVDQGRVHLDQDVEFIVNNVLQTSAGRMIFGRMDDGVPPPTRRTRPRSDSQSSAPA